MSATKHEDKMVNLQQQLQQNQMDLQDFLQDMTKWEDDIRKKESTLSTKASDSDAKLPPVRNSLDKKKHRKKKKEKSTKGKEESKDSKSQPPKKINGYDYRSWDKFDIDKALEEVDGQKETSSSEYETDDDWEDERKKHLAEQEKEKGNELFKRGDYDAAVECYSKGIDLDPTNPLLPANRAMALIKQEKYAAAEVDATTAITLDPLYVKAYMRRASCRVGMQKLEDAKSDYQRILTLEPQNKSAKTEMEKLEKVLNRSAEEQPEIMSFTSSESGIVMPVYKTPEQRSKKPLRRVEIEEIGVEEDTTRREAIAKAKAKQSEAKQIITQKDESMFEKFTESKPQNKKAVIIEEVCEKTDTVKSESDNTDTVTKKKEQEERKLEKQSNDTGVSILPSLTSLEDVSSRPVPQTSYQFQADYKVLKHERQAFYQYFKRISPAKLPSLFGQMLDSDILINILTTIKDCFIPAGESFEEHLVSLTKVKRFDMTAMFLSKKEKEVVTCLISDLRKSSKSSQDEISRLAKKYGLS